MTTTPDLAQALHRDRLTSLRQTSHAARTTSAWRWQHRAERLARRAERAARRSDRAAARARLVLGV